MKIGSFCCLKFYWSFLEFNVPFQIIIWETKMWERLSNFWQFGKVHNYLLDQTQHNDFRISRSTECLTILMTLKLLISTGKSYLSLWKKLFWEFRNSKKHIFRETSLRRFLKGWFWTASISYLYKPYFQRNWIYL